MVKLQMKIAAISDMHTKQNKVIFNRLPREFFKPQADVLIINGDCCDGIEDLDLVLNRFSDFNGQIIFNPGNHEMWSKDGEDSINLYKNVIPNKLTSYGIHYLPSSNFILGDYVIVGEMGWFDFSYRKPVPENIKILNEEDGHFDLGNKVIKQRELEDYDFKRGCLGYRVGGRLIFSFNNDVKNVSKNLDHKDFTDLNINNLENKILEVPITKKIVLVTHFIPAEKFIHNDVTTFYMSAFLGTKKTEPLLKNKQIDLVIFGHQHVPKYFINDGKRYCNPSFNPYNPKITILDL